MASKKKRAHTSQSINSRGLRLAKTSATSPDASIASANDRRRGSESFDDQDHSTKMFACSSTADMAVANNRKRVPGCFDERHVLRPHAPPFQPSKPGPEQPLDPAWASVPRTAAPIIQQWADSTASDDPTLATSHPALAPIVKRFAEPFMCCAQVEPWGGPANPQPALNNCFEWLQAGRETEVTTGADPPCYIEYWEFQRASDKETWQTCSIRYLYPVSADENDPFTVWKELVHQTAATTKLFLVSYSALKDVEGWVNCDGPHMNQVSYKLKYYKRR